LGAVFGGLPEGKNSPPPPHGDQTDFGIHQGPCFAFYNGHVKYWFGMMLVIIKN